MAKSNKIETERFAFFFFSPCIFKAAAVDFWPLEDKGDKEIQNSEPNKCLSSREMC